MPHQLNPVVVVDAAVKKSLGYPLSVIAEDMGEPLPRIKRITTTAAADQMIAAALRNQTGAPAAPQPPTRVTGE
ncbi:hypothetical protein GCM10027294_45390 [Marinactinospora endophytica]